MKKIYICSFLVGAALLAGAQNAVARRDCDVTDALCGPSTQRTVERPAGLVNGKNGVFALNRPPANGSHVALFNTGLELAEGTDYKVIDRQIMVIGSSIPQPGDVLTAVYSPASKTERSAVLTIGTPAKSGDITEMALREALNTELGVIGESKRLHVPTDGVSALQMIRDRQIAVPSRVKLNFLEGGVDGLGDRIPGSSIGRTNRERLTGGLQWIGRGRSKALETLEERKAAGPRIRHPRHTAIGQTTDEIGRN